VTIFETLLDDAESAISFPVLLGSSQIEYMDQYDLHEGVYEDSHVVPAHSPDQEPIRMSSLLMLREAARRLGVSYPTIKQWIYKGAIRTVRTAGGHHRVPDEEVDRLLADKGQPPPARRKRRLPPRGVLVALSGRNQLRGTVTEVRLAGLLAQVRLRVGDQMLTAVITRDAVDELRLKAGDSAVAIIKATEVMIARER
jgi:molybdopterin-binding protein